jgi:tetratricopeptide (TPR) repeat protein
LAWALFDVGELDRAEDLATRHLPVVLHSREAPMVEMHRMVLVMVATIRGELAELERLVIDLDPDVVTLELMDEWPTYMTKLAAAQAALGRRAEALAILDKVASADREMGGANHVISLGVAVRLAVELDALELANRLVAGAQATFPGQRYSLRLAEALVAEAQGRGADAVSAFEEAAVGYGGFRVRSEEGVAWLGVARTRLALGRREDAAAALVKARAAFEMLRATPWLTKCDALARDLGSVDASV